MAVHLLQSSSPQATEEFATKLGRQFRGGEIVELIGDLGAGKTTFVRGLAVGLGSHDPVSSPTFAISNVYDGKLKMYHSDLYRLHDDRLVKEELSELLNDKGAVLVFEWAGELLDVLPRERLKIEFKATAESERVLRLQIPPQYNYLELA